MRIYNAILFHVSGGLAGVFAWLSVQPWNQLGWAYAFIAGLILSNVIQKAALAKQNARVKDHL